LRAVAPRAPAVTHAFPFPGASVRRNLLLAAGCHAPKNARDVARGVGGKCAAVFVQRMPLARCADAFRAEQAQPQSLIKRVGRNAIETAPTLATAANDLGVLPLVALLGIEHSPD